MTISSLAKFIAGVKRMVVENVEVENAETNPTIIISVRPAKRDSCRCGICGKKCSGYDKGNGRRRWRAMDIGNSCKVYLESDSPRVWCKEHGAVVQQVPWARHGSKHTRGFEDIRKYASGVDQARIINVFNRIAPQLARENKKFQISKVESGARFRDYRGCAEWLADAGMVNIGYCMEFPELPLGGNYEPDTFKRYFADTGLLVSMLDDESQENLRANKNLGVYKGALYENMVGEALVKQ